MWCVGHSSEVKAPALVGTHPRLNPVCFHREERRTAKLSTLCMCNEMVGSLSIVNFTHVRTSLTCWLSMTHGSLGVFIDQHAVAAAQLAEGHHLPPLQMPRLMVAMLLCTSFDIKFQLEHRLPKTALHEPDQFRQERVYTEGLERVLTTKIDGFRAIFQASQAFALRNIGIQRIG